MLCSNQLSYIAVLIALWVVTIHCDCTQDCGLPWGLRERLRILGNSPSKGKVWLALRGHSAPHPLGYRDHQLQLALLVVMGQQVALFHAGKTALW